MKAPDGTIDLIGTGLNLGLAITGLIGQLSPDADTRKARRLRRRIKVAKYALKHGFKGSNITSYVALNFSDYPADIQANVVETLTDLIK
jgi:hypothetical protein